MKNYASNTTNRGTTIILDSPDEAIGIGREYLKGMISRNRVVAPDSMMTARIIVRDKPEETKEQTWGTYLSSLKKRASVFETAVDAIIAGDEMTNRDILDKADQLLELVTAIEPSLSASYAGFKRSEDGIAADVGLLASGDNRPFFQRKTNGEISSQGRRGRAYRILLSTDVTWFGNPNDNAAVVGSLVVCLQRFGPVELWIQQGWLGKEDGDGVTLFKLDFDQGFQPTQLAFWIGHELKDDSFSFEINMGLGRNSGGSADSAEIPADLFLRGDWMKLYGVNENFHKLLHTEKMDIMAKWIAETAMQIVSTGHDGESAFAF